MSDGPKTAELDTLLMQLVSGDISQDEVKRLQNAVGRDSEHLDYCRDFMMVSCGLGRLLHEQDQQASVWLKETLKGELEKPVTVRSRIPWKQAVTALAAMVLMGLAVTYVIVNRGGRAKSHLGEVINGLSLKWADPTLSSEKGTALGAEPRHLIQGLAEIKLASGTHIIVQGPSRFSLENDNQIYLTSGTVTAKVPEKARGFILRTQQASVVDYGTEFGVLVRADGTLETHVFSGTVQVKGGGGSDTITLDAGSSVVLTKTGAPRLGQTDNQRFARRLPSRQTRACPGSRLDLADVVGGGNGYGTGRLGQGIDPASGRPLAGIQGKRRHTRREGFIPLEDHRYIDGVFVPTGATSVGQSGVAVSSTGLMFDRVPTTDGSYYDGIFNGAQFASQGQARPGKLNGEFYGTPERPALSLHPNAGITFDLHAINGDNPGVFAKSFRALCGISETAGSTHRQRTDFWVLVDGEVSYHHQCLPGEFSTGLINVRLDSSARFLTLITTCAGDPTGCWGFFGNPTLEFSPTGR